MGNCSGNCASCGGCGRALELTEGEIAFLRELGQIPFLPVARAMGDLTPIWTEPGDETNMSLLLQCLEKKGLISLDYDKPLGGYHSPRYDAAPIRGSLALTQRGQLVLEMLDYQGVLGE